MATTETIILLIAIPLLVLFFIICAIYTYFKICHRRNRNEDTEHLLEEDFSQSVSYESMSVMDKVNLERRQSIKKSKESAFVFLQFYFRSNPNRTFQLVEQLHNIGHQPETERSWFLCKETVENVNKYRMIFVNTFETTSNPKKKHLLDIADSMLLNVREMQTLTADILTSVKHPHILTFETVEMDFDKGRILFIQDYSRDGSLRDLIRNLKPEQSWELKSKPLERKTSLPIKTIREYTKQILSALMYLNTKLVFPMDNLHAGNVILALKKRVCLITGFESMLLLKKNRVDLLNEKCWMQVVKSYLLKATGDNNEDEIVIRKAKNDIELKEIVQVLRVGLLVIEMCIGIECDQLMPPEHFFTEIGSAYKQNEANEIMTFLRFLFHNKRIIEDKNGKSKGKNC